MNKLKRPGLIHSLFFAPAAPENARLSFGSKCALIIALFLVTRLVTIWGFHERQVDWFHHSDFVADPYGFVSTAQYIQQHGYMPTENEARYRQFAGLSLAMLVPDLVLHNLVWSGYLVVGVSAVLSLILIQHLFDDFRLSLIACVFLPYCITTTCTIFAEAPTMLCFLVGLWVLRDFRQRPALLYLGVFMAGYCLVLRQSAGFFVVPFLGVMAWRTPGGGLFFALKVLAVAALPMVIYLAWCWFTIHQFFPQYKLHHDAFMAELSVVHDASRYSRSMFDVPFHSLFAGLTDSYERLGKRLSILATVCIAFLALGLLCRESWRGWGTARGAMALAFAVALAVHMLFHFSLGGVFGYKWLDRHFSQLNPIIDWALFYRRNLRWPWIALLVVGGIVFAIGTGAGSRYWFFKQ